MNAREFKVYHKELKDYSSNLINRNYYTTRRKVNTVCIDDLVSEAILNNCYDIESAKKVMRMYLLKESNIAKGKRQFGNISFGYEKKCNKCNKIKLACEYSEILDKRFNYIYLRNNCNKCHSQIAKKYRLNNPLTKEQKLKAKIRYERYKLKQKEIS